MAKKMGRPAVDVDWKKVDDMLAAGCIGTEIASSLGFSADTLYRHCEQDFKMTFTAYMQQKRAKGDALIRIAQFDEAVRGRDRGMLIWLGKQRLGQTDKEQVEHKGDVPIQIVSYTGKPIEPWKDDEKETAANGQ